MVSLAECPGGFLPCGAWPDRPGHFIANGGFKIGFGMAGADFLVAALRSHGPALLLDATARGRGIINTRHAEALIRQHRGGGGRHHHRLWSLLILEAWLRTFIDRPDPAAAGPMDFSGA